jgi:hypothetical protein
MSLVIPPENLYIGALGHVEDFQWSGRAVLRSRVETR